MVEGVGGAGRDGEVLPVLLSKVFGDEGDLACMPGVVGGLAVDGFEDGVGFGADGDDSGEVGIGEGGEGGKEGCPAGGVEGEELWAGKAAVCEFGFAVARGLFAVGGEEVGEAGEHVAGHVLEDAGDGVLEGIELEVEFGVGELGKRAVDQGFGFLEFFFESLEVEAGHGRLLLWFGDCRRGGGGFFETTESTEDTENGNG